MRFKKWFSFKGIISEAKNVSWLKGKKLAKNSFSVLAFCVIMGLFFYGGDALIAVVLTALGMN